MTAPHAPGPGAALRSLGRTLLDILRTRVDLLTIEMAQERQRLAQLVLLALLGLVSLVLFLGFGGLLAMACSWDTPYRWPVAGSIVGLFAAGAAGCAGAAAWMLQCGP